MSTIVWKIPNQISLQISFKSTGMESLLQLISQLTISIYQQSRNTWKMSKMSIQIPLRVLVFPKSKSYMKIVGLPYSSKLWVITPDLIKGVLKDSYLFKNTVLASKPCVIKASPKSDKAVVWVDIWDSQSSSCAKNIINCWFNVGQFIATMHRTNMNLGVPQYKNYWKWGHLTLSCHSHISRCTKCHGAHDTKHHREKAWCCIENKKLNHLATKDSEPCPHIFKCKGDHQVDSYSCPYWCNHFNREWHSRKQQELSQK